VHAAEESDRRRVWAGAAQHEGLDREALSIGVDLAQHAPRHARAGQLGELVQREQFGEFGSGHSGVAEMGGSQDGGRVAIKASHTHATVS